MRRVLCIVGPTASGKTDAGVETAFKLNGEIISTDSRQVYKHIPIASAVPPEMERKGIPHHFMEELNLNEEFNAGEFGKQGRVVVDEIFEKRKQPIVVGGSGLYLYSLIDGFFDEEIESKEVRKELYEKLKAKGREFLYNELKEVDKIAAAAMMPHNVRRVIRALEIYYASGRKISDLQKKKIEINFEPIQIGLLWDRKELYERINRRVDEMLKAGLVEEVRELKDRGFDCKKNNSLNTVGIKEVFAYLEDEINYADMVDLIKQNTRRYAKRQMTWFKRDDRINWVKMNHDMSTRDIVPEIIALFEKE